MKKIIVALAMILGITIMAAPSAQATTGCITLDEFKTIGMGWTKSQVNAITDARGDRYYVNGNKEAYLYEPCNHNDFKVHIQFTNGTVNYKIGVYNDTIYKGGVGFQT